MHHHSTESFPFQHNVHGSSVIRALWDEFPSDRSTWGIDAQFLWGSGLLVSPVVLPGRRTKEAYFPYLGGQRWYDITQWLRKGHYQEGPITEVERMGWQTIGKESHSLLRMQGYR